MGKSRRNRNGSAMVLALLFVTFFMMVAAGVVPFAIAQVKHSSANVDVVEAQYAAEAGAKRAIVGIMQGNTSWGWANNQMHNAVADGTDATKYYYINSITNTVTTNDKTITDNTKPSTTATYTVTSTGYVNGVTRTVKATVTPSGGGGGVFGNAAFSKASMTIISGSVTGNIAAGSLYIGNGMKVNGNAAYTTLTSQTTSDIQSKVSGTATQSNSIGTLDVASLMYYPPTMPTFSVSKAAKALPQYDAALTGSYNYDTNPNSGAYYYGSDFSNWNYTYTVASGQSVFIYVKGDYIIGKPITGNGDITVYATGNVTVHGLSGNTVKIYAGKNITLYNNPIVANDVTLQSTGDINISGGGVQSGGAVNIYAGGVLDMGAGSIVGSVVTMTANGTKTNTAADLHGVKINVGYPNNITRIYVNGNADMGSGSIGGAAMLVATGTIDLHGTASSAVLIANGDIEAASGSAAGLYTNGSINSIHGATITYSDTILSQLGISGGTVTYTIKWSN